MAGGGGDGVNWEGLLKWSLAHADGTRPPRSLSEEDRRWFMEAMQAQTVDVVKRMKEITLVMKTPEDVLQAQGVTSVDIEDLLDELQEHVESIDMANDLHSIGGLVPLIGYLNHSDAGIRAKAADVVTTIVQNNPRSQQLVMEASGFEPLLSNFKCDPDLTVRTKALGAISSLIRNNKAGIAAFRLANGFAGLRDALVTNNARLQRKALNLIQYLLRENNLDCGVVSELGFPRIMIRLVSSEDAHVREAALGGLLLLARNETSGSSKALAEDEKLKEVLQSRIQGISTMPTEDLGSIREERQLVDSLWGACYSEPSALREKGLVVLPGEDSPQPLPDVAGRMFEPPLRAFAARQTQKESSSSSDDGKKQSPLPLGPGPAAGSSPQDHNVFYPWLS